MRPKTSLDVEVPSSEALSLYEEFFAVWGLTSKVWDVTDACFGEVDVMFMVEVL